MRGALAGPVAARLQRRMTVVTPILRAARARAHADSGERLCEAAAPTTRRRARGPPRTSSSSAVSRTPARQDTVLPRQGAHPPSGASETRPRCGLRPTRPQHAAGILSEPPPSLPCAIGTIPAATAAADPPEEPPGVRPRSHGLRAGPPRRELGDRQDPPLRQRRRADDDEAGVSQPARDAVVVRRRRQSPPEVRAATSTAGRETARLFFIAIGTPANGRGSPGAIAAAAARAPLVVDVDERVDLRLQRVDAPAATHRRARPPTAPRRARAPSARPPDGA